MVASDRELWNGILRQDTTVFNAFYREQAPRLQAFLRQVVGNGQTAEDIAQETFTQLWKRPQGFDPERGTLRAYLFGIGRKQAAAWWRRRKPAEEWTEDRPGDGDAEVDSMVADAFRRLPEGQRTLLWPREVEGHSYAELAVILDIPVGTVRSRLFAAREALREIWHGAPCAGGGQHEVR